MDHCTTSPDGPLLSYPTFVNTVVGFLDLDSQGCFTTTSHATNGVEPLRQSHAGIKTKGAGCLPEGRQGRGFTRPPELILTVAGYEPPRNGERS